MEGHEYKLRPSLTHRSRRRSKDIPLDFSQFRRSASEFLRLYSEKRRRLKEIKAELYVTQEDSHRTEEATAALVNLGIGACSVGFVLGLNRRLIPSLPKLGTCVMGAGGGAVVLAKLFEFVQTYRTKSREQSKKSELASILRSLKDTLQRLQDDLTDLRLEDTEEDTERRLMLSDLKLNLLSVRTSISDLLGVSSTHLFFWDLHKALDSLEKLGPDLHQVLDTCCMSSTLPLLID